MQTNSPLMERIKKRGREREIEGESEIGKKGYISPEFGAAK